MSETTSSDAVLAHLEALTARLDRLETENVALKAENARLMEPRPSGADPVAEPNTGAPGPSVARRHGGGRPAGAGVLRRRGLLAGVAALMGAGLAKLARPEAVQAGVDGDVVLGGRSPAAGAVTSSTEIVANIQGPSAALDVVNKGYTGFKVFASPAIAGYTTGVGAPAFFARNESADGIGYMALMVNGFGVSADATSGIGVLGTSTNGIGVEGSSTNNAGVYGVGPIGVFATGTGTAAVYGASNGTYGVWGNSAGSAGLIGTSAGYIGVEAISTSHWGLRAKSPTYAGVFEGNVFVTGQVIALGGVVGVSGTSAGGSGARALAEDVGEGTLVNGRATVALSQAFAEEVKGGQYHVFVTPHDASVRGLAVVARRKDGFDVQELAGAGVRSGGGTFSYRVVTRGPASAETRAVPLALPDLTTVKPVPEPPELPKPPAPGGPSEGRRGR